MRYKLYTDKYILREENDYNKSLMIKETNQVIFLNTTAALIIKQSEKNLDTESIAKQVSDTFDEDYANVLADINLTVLQLQAFGILEVLDKVSENLNNGIKIAGEEDYFIISNFIRQNMSNKHCYYTIINKEYYDMVSIRARQFNNLEYNIMVIEDNELLAVMVVSVPPQGSIMSSMILNSFTIQPNLSYQKVKIIINNILQFITETFTDDFNVIYFYRYDARYADFLETLLELGFSKKYIYEKVIQKKRDLIVYDKII